jgi:hypothetical protein
MSLKKKRGFVTKYSVSRKLCPGLVIFHKKERLWRTLKKPRALKVAGEKWTTPQ